MSTAAQIRDYWNGNLWIDSTVRKITPQIFDYNILQREDESSFDNSKLYNRNTNKIHFFQYWVTRTPTRGIVSGGSLENLIFRVFVEYYKEPDPEGNHFHQIQDDLTTVQGRLRATLGDNWGGLIEGWNYDATEISPAELGQIDGRGVWGSDFTITAFGKASI